VILPETARAPLPDGGEGELAPVILPETARRSLPDGGGEGEALLAAVTLGVHGSWTTTLEDTMARFSPLIFDQPWAALPTSARAGKHLAVENPLSVTLHESACGALPSSGAELSLVWTADLPSTSASLRIGPPEGVLPEWNLATAPCNMAAASAPAPWLLITMGLGASLEESRLSFGERRSTSAQISTCPNVGLRTGAL